MLTKQGPNGQSSYHLKHYQSQSQGEKEEPRSLGRTAPCPASPSGGKENVPQRRKSQNSSANNTNDYHTLVSWWMHTILSKFNSNVSTFCDYHLCIHVWVHSHLLTLHYLTEIINLHASSPTKLLVYWIWKVYLILEFLAPRPFCVLLRGLLNQWEINKISLANQLFIGVWHLPLDTQAFGIRLYTFPKEVKLCHEKIMYFCIIINEPARFVISITLNPIPRILIYLICNINPFYRQVRCREVKELAMARERQCTNEIPGHLASDSYSWQLDCADIFEQCNFLKGWLSTLGNTNKRSLHRSYQWYLNSYLFID